MRLSVDKFLFFSFLKSTIEDSINVECDIEQMSVALHISQLDNFQILHSTRATDCGILELPSSKSNSDFLTFSTKLDECETRMEMNETHIIYSKQLTLDINQQNIDIIRHRKLDIEFGCAYQLWNAGTLQTAATGFASFTILTEEAVFVEILGANDIVWPRLKDCWAVPK